MAQETERPADGLNVDGARPECSAVVAEPVTFSASNYKGQAENPDPARDMRAIMAANPNLTINGYAVRHWGVAEFAALLEPRHLKAFTAARAWLRQFPQTKTTLGSYGLKHDAEREMGMYLANGSLIAAAIAEGFPVKRLPGTPNAEIGVRTKAGRARRRS